MTSSDLINHYKLIAHIQHDYTVQLIHKSDPINGRRKVTIEKRWHKVKRLGQGAYGVVYLEREETNGVESQRAVKQVPKLLQSGATVDYSRELSAMAILSKHEEVFVLFHGWYETVHNVFLAMEYVPYGDLQQRVRSTLPEDEARAITTQILEGLGIMHAHSITHRDLKPQNIFVVRPAPDWWVKIGDFGVSKRVESSDTALRTVAGTFNFIAPEILGLIEESESTSGYTNAVDIWSLGCITYGLLTLKAPFSDNRELAKFCRGRLAFPVQNLEENKVTTDAIVFLKQLLVAEPSERKRAQESLVSLWLAGNSARRLDDKPSDKNHSNSEGMLSSTISLSKKQPDPMNIKTTRTEPSSHTTPGVAQSLPQQDQNSIATQNHSFPVIPFDWQTGNPDTALRSASNKSSSTLSVVHGAAKASETALSNQTRHVEGATDHGLLKRMNEGISTEHIKAFLDAASEGDLETLEILIQRGINVNTRGFEEIAPGPWTDAWGFESVLENIAQYRLWREPPRTLSFRETGLHRAIIHKRTSAACFLLEQGADCSAQDTAFGAPALVWAAAVGSEALVRKLLQSGADVDAKSDDDRAAIHLAAKNGHTSVIQLLLDGMATPAARDERGRTPLHWAASHGHFRIVRLLCLTPGVDIEARTIFGETPLHFAAKGGKIGAVKMLLHKGADINAQVTRDGFTALHYAVHHIYRVGNVQQELVSLLLDKGVDINAETDEGRTALYFARACDDRPIVKLLEQRGAKMGTKDRLASGALGAVDSLFKLF